MEQQLYAVKDGRLSLSLTTHAGTLEKSDVVENLVKAMKRSLECGEDWKADLLEHWYQVGGMIAETDEETLESEEAMYAEARELVDTWGINESRATTLLNEAGWKKQLEPLDEDQLDYMDSEEDIWSIKTIITEHLPYESPMY